MTERDESPYQKVSPRETLGDVLRIRVPPKEDSGRHETCVYVRPVIVLHDTNKETSRGVNPV